MRFVLLITSLFICFNSFSQKSWTEITELKDFRPESGYSNTYFWNDTITKNQKEYFYNGSLGVFYKNNGNKSKTKHSYFFNGGKFVINEVYQDFKIDTFWQINGVTLEDEQIIQSGISDFYHGEYTEFYKNDVSFKNFIWEDLSAENQTEKYKQGTIKVKYEAIDSTHKIRFDYDIDGKLIRKSKVHQFFRIDTTWQIDANTLEDKQVLIPGYRDKFDSIIFFKNEKIKLKGQFKDDKQIGLWQLFLNNKLVEASFDENGKLSGGLYTEYYFFENEIVGLKEQGSYQRKVVKIKTDGVYKYNKVVFIRKGKWTFYRKDGSVRKTYKY